MRKIWSLVRYDAKHVFTNVISLVVCVGMIVVPCFYAWFNIAASWDPYGNTSNLKVAVANADSGYTSELIPVSVNMGERMETELRKSDSIGYTVTSEDDAVEGVRSGKYYAAIVFPENFTRDLLSGFANSASAPKVTFYQNDKESAIGKIVTSKASTAVQQDIDESFAQALTTVGGGVLDELVDYLGDDQMSELATKLDSAVDSAQQGLTETAGTVRSFQALLDSTRQLLGSGTDASTDTLSATLDAGSGLRQTAGDVRGLGTSVDGTVDSVNKVLSQGASALDGVSSQIDHAFDVAGSQSDKLADGLRQAAAGVSGNVNQLNDLIDRLSGVESNLRDAMGRLEEGTSPYNALQDMAASVAELEDQLREVVRQQGELYSELLKTADDLDGGKATAEGARATLKASVEAAKAGIGSVRDSYESDVRGSLSSLAGTIESAADEADGISASVSSTLESLRATTASATSGVAEAASGVADGANSLDEAATKLGALHGKLRAALDSDDISLVRDVLSGGPDALASFISAPVSMDRTAVYQLDNNGSGMAPFYTTLAIWIGGVVLCALVKANPSEKCAELLGLAPHQAYLGRIVFFLILGFLQSSLILLGDLYFLQVQCAHPLLFLLAGWAASFVFVNIIYALTASFGDVGKAIAVLLMVIQVAGSGGTFPVQMLPEGFQAVYPFLPFVHSENAMRAAMFGLYGNDFWVELGLLLSYVAAALLLGLLLRKPVIRLTEWIEHKLESTKLM